MRRRALRPANNVNSRADETMAAGAKAASFGRNL